MSKKKQVEQIHELELEVRRLHNHIYKLSNRLSVVEDRSIELLRQRLQASLDRYEAIHEMQ